MTDVRRSDASFGDAVDEIRYGLAAMRLPQWKSEVLIKYQSPDENSKMTAPYLYVESRFGRVPWIPTMIELLSTEWNIVEVSDARR